MSERPVHFVSDNSIFNVAEQKSFKRGCKITPLFPPHHSKMVGWSKVIKITPPHQGCEVRWLWDHLNFSEVRWGDLKSPQFLMRWGEVRWLSKKILEEIVALESKNNNKFAYFSILRWGEVISISSQNFLGWGEVILKSPRFFWGEVRWFWNHPNFCEVRWGDLKSPRITSPFSWGEVKILRWFYIPAPHP